jgi:uncharacterized protein YbjT (DUF2867 family)
MTMTTEASRPVLVVGATGAVGGEVIAALLATGARVRVLVRDPDRVSDLPGDVERAQGDLHDPASLTRALTGVRSAFYVSPHEADEVELARNFVEACERAGVRLVFAGVHVYDRNPVRQVFYRLLFRLWLRHYQGKLELARAIERSNTRPVIVMPTNFMQNDDVFLDDIQAGEFCQPLAGVNRVDLRDVAQAVASVLLDDEFPSGAYSLVGPETLSGKQCAEVWERELGRQVRYIGDDERAWKEAFARHLHGRKLADWQASFTALSTLKVKTSAADLEETRRLIGREPRRYDEYVHDRATAHQVEARVPNT